MAAWASWISGLDRTGRKELHTLTPPAAECSTYVGKYSTYTTYLLSRLRLTYFGSGEEEIVSERGVVWGVRGEARDRTEWGFGILGVAVCGFLSFLSLTQGQQRPDQPDLPDSQPVDKIQTANHQDGAGYVRRGSNVSDAHSLTCALEAGVGAVWMDGRGRGSFGM